MAVSVLSRLLANMLVDHISRQEAEDLVRHCLEEGEVIPGWPFREELPKQRLVFEDVWVVLRTGHVYNQAEPNPKMGEWEHQIEGYEPGGKWLVIVLNFKTVERTYGYRFLCRKQEVKT